MIGGHPALRLLARRKFIGILRKQVRRLKTSQGVVLALIGFGAIALWIWSILARNSIGSMRGARTVMSAETARFFGMVISVMSLVSALSFRGLYLPREEIELLFSAPVSRSDVIRYRLWISLCKSLFGSVFMALVATRSVPVPAFGFVGVFLLGMTLPLAAQMVSLFAGDVENRWIQRLPKGALRTVNLLGIVLILAFVFSPSSGGGSSFETGSTQDLFKRVPTMPVISVLTLPMWPWATLATSASPSQFFALLPLCVVIWWLLYQACVRIPIDYRELSLETSADVARRLSRLRRGTGGAAAGKADSSAAGWRVPWLFGRSPFGALAWRKTGTILRKARGTLMISGAVVLLLVLATIKLFENDPRSSPLGASIIIGAFGTIYLCAGLRFDFREDLDRMDVVKSWPIASWQVFLATILPEVVLVAGFVILAILARIAYAGSFPVEVLGVLALVIPTVLGWVAIDNAVFLVWPVRLTPGQEGMLQQVGRSMVLMLLRVLATLIVGGVVVAGVALAWYARKWIGYSEQMAIMIASSAALAVLLGECALLVYLGGRALSRFDVARDR
ncbi:MAG TPA: putative ABC exporter domain-containing protein [Planctomycetota bacterium]|nr:putative ABC exporter domain-containing protein [Planctomycetota bacterium]